MGLCYLITPLIPSDEMKHLVQKSILFGVKFGFIATILTVFMRGKKASEMGAQQN